jgi:hypothetical protein
MMSDDELRATLQAAHGDDAAPPFAAVLGRALRRRRWPFAVALPLAAAAVALLILLLRPHAPPPSLTVELRDPLAFLLEPPAGDEVLRSIPQFDTGGDLQ